MLAALVGVEVAAGLLLRGAWDGWAQSALLLLACAGASAWAAWAVLRGRVPSPDRRVLGWTLALIALSLLSALSSPVPAYSVPAWAASAAGLALIPAASLMSARERERVEQALRAAAWVLVLLAVHQKLDGVDRPTSALPNQNAFAGAILLLLPFSVRRGDYPLAAGLLLCLWWSRSVGAWLGLSVALVLHRRAVGAAAFWAGALAGFAGLVAAYAKLQSPEVLHRWGWWEAASRMTAGAPWLGLGPGAYAYALPSFVAGKPELNSLYAHQHFLETAAERGVPYLLLWVAGLGALLRRADGSRRFGPVAALAHGLVDYALSIPAVFWLFCLSAAWSLPESDEAVAVPARRKAPALGALAAAAVAACVWLANGWRADALRARASFAASESRFDEADALLARSESVRPHPEAARLRAEIARVRALGGGGDPAPALTLAAAELEKAVALDPYRASSWAMLEDCYRRLGREDDARAARARGAAARGGGA